MFNQTFQLGAFTPHREFLLELCHLLFNGKQVQISVVQQAEKVMLVSYFCRKLNP